MSAFSKSGRSVSSFPGNLSVRFRPSLRQNVPEFDSNGPAHHYRVAAVVAGFLVPTFIRFHSQNRSYLPPDCANFSFDAASATSRPSESKRPNQEHGHLIPRDLCIRAVVISSTARSNSFSRKLLDPASSPMIHIHITEDSRSRRRGIH